MTPRGWALRPPATNLSVRCRIAAASLYSSCLRATSSSACKLSTGGSSPVVLARSSRPFCRTWRGVDATPVDSTKINHRRVCAADCRDGRVFPWAAKRTWPASLRRHPRNRANRSLFGGGFGCGDTTDTSSVSSYGSPTISCGANNQEVAVILS